MLRGCARRQLAAVPMGERPGVCAADTWGTSGETSPLTPQCFSQALALASMLIALETKVRSPRCFGRCTLGLS